ncbi:SmpA/OmlA domain protein [Pseudovibrio sp. FO-BEG1]|uniref:Beta-barrel assembly machine subunit BamE n=2 Tax=Pseudovibrio TaxID=258255 RepID=A0A1I7BPN1_9HYPH|nr:MULTISPECIES: outer membrane protein assembly factor BamE [Pseudovibrio]AEV38079.1 SmpA/OmlA domain protein [Pseudovibrio sp. FO-BEG1]EEA96546.1 smAll protein a [Pseudovibrio sp. JE062]QUS54254.1 outer membrane protein assembly factor BamE [Pseudovibrio brasiliensis]SFT89108.1 Beta-barrel assembly machine subunit BamE [Pseudovibrio denitrificans]
MFAFARRTVFLACLSLPLAGCFTQTLTHGQVVSPDAIQDVQVGSSREQVELLLGSPSTTSNLDGEAYYYISQKSETVAFWSPSIVDQRVVAVYFDKDGYVKSVADYGIEDGKVFDYLGRKTRTGGADYGLLTQILRGAANPSIGL